MSWARGQVIVRREVLNDGRLWMASTVRVVEDTPDQLVTYLPSGTPFAFLDGTFPSDTGHHPWEEQGRWGGHGTLMVQRPGDDYAVWHFWSNPERSFACWYINLQEAFRRTAIGYDTQDLELDLVVRDDGSWQMKDRELLDRRIAQGRFTAAQSRQVIALGERLGAELDAGRRWWDHRWATWAPDPSWWPTTVPDGWVEVPTHAPCAAARREACS